MRITWDLPSKEAELQQQIWTDYVKHMVERKGDANRYLLQHTLRWLSWLARQMRAHNQTVFYLEQLQPDWFPQRQRKCYQWSAGLLFGLSTGLLFGLLTVLFFGLGTGPFFGLFFGLLVMLSGEHTTAALLFGKKRA